MAALALCLGREAEGLDGSSASPSSLTKVNTPDPALSSGDISPVSQTLPAAWNAAAFRRSFPAAWAQYLRDAYRTAYAVEKAFGIDSKTARDWIGGKRDPSGSFVIAAVSRDPEALKILGGM